MNQKIDLSKIEVAKRQLETAVQLYFNDLDPVSIHTLTCASHEILSSLNKRANGAPSIMSDHLILDPYKEEYRRKLTEAKSFFKHADRDPDALLSFKPEINEYFLLDACELYEILTTEKNTHFVIYRFWFKLQNPQFLNLPLGQLNTSQFAGKLDYYSRMLASSAIIH